MNVLIKLINNKLLKGLMPKRPQDSHKGVYGKVSVICGSRDMPGASRLVSRGAYIVGAGLVYSYAGESFASYLKNDIPEVIVKTVKESLFKTFPEDLYLEIGKEIQESDVVAFGCGVGQNTDLKKTINDLIINNKKVLVIDGDGINLLQNNLDLLKNQKGAIILTPHPKEFSRITGLSVEEILKNREEIVQEFSKRYSVYLLLKGSSTIISNPAGELYLNTTGNSALSKGGTGDVLTGFIAGFVAQGLTPLTSMLVSAYLHGKSGGIASKELTEYSVMATDLIYYLPKAIKSLQGDG